MMISDAILVKSFCDGNDLAFVNLYNRYKHPIYVFCFKMLDDGNAAEDLVQNIFFKLYARKNQINQPERLKQWLYAVARNECLSYIEKFKRTSPFDPENEIDSGISLHGQYDSEEEVGLLSKAIEQLTQEYKEVLLLRLYNDLSYKEIAEILDLKETVVKSRLFEARKKLYKILKPIFEERV
ncbi:MAG: RNA polymerase sigma factor [Ignavibacteriales bacterium]|nr:RNA polymerase sigma factor [Ignavibacteriales bacterium]